MHMQVILDSLFSRLIQPLEGAQKRCSGTGLCQDLNVAVMCLQDDGNEDDILKMV